MRGVLVEVPESLLEERRLTGMDAFDELWDGELHMAPTASSAHGRLGRDLFLVLEPEARRRGLESFFDGTGLYRTAHDYRVPDQQYVRPETVTDRGTGEGADLIVELRSPGDESFAKLDWYAALQVREMLVVDVATREVHLFAGVDGRPVLVGPDANGVVRSRVLGVGFTTVDGPALRVHTDQGVSDL